MSLHGVARVEDEMAFHGHEVPVDGFVLGDDEDHVGFVEALLGEGHALEVTAVDAELGNVGVVVDQLGAFGVENAHDVHGGAFAAVVDVGLVGHPEDQDLGAVEALLLGVQGVGDAEDDEVGHLAVDGAGQLDEAGVVVQALELPAEVEGVDGDTVSTQAGAGIEGLESEGLGGRRVDHVPHVDAELVAHDADLVGQADVDGSVGVLENFHHLGGLGALHGDHRVDEVLVEGAGGLRGGRVDAAHDLGGVLRLVDGVAGSTRSGEKARKRVSPINRPEEERAGRRTSRVVPG